MEEKMLKDSFWIDQFLSGNQRGFTVLVEKYQNKVMNIVYSLIGQDRESQDIAQEVFLKVYHNLASFKKRSQFSTWLYRITVNATYSFLRKRKSFRGNDEVLEKITAAGSNPQEALLKKEKKELFEAALAKVPLKFKIALVFKDVEGLSYREIADILKCRLGTVESKIYRGRQFLKKEIFLKEEE